MRGVCGLQGPSWAGRQGAHFAPKGPGWKHPPSTHPWMEDRGPDPCLPVLQGGWGLPGPQGSPAPWQVELESGGGLSVPHCRLRAKTAPSRAGPPPRAAAPGTRCPVARVSHSVPRHIPAVCFSCNWPPAGSFEVDKGGAQRAAAAAGGLLFSRFHLSLVPELPPRPLHGQDPARPPAPLVCLWPPCPTSPRAALPPYSQGSL